MMSPFFSQESVDVIRKCCGAPAHSRICSADEPLSVPVDKSLSEGVGMMVGGPMEGSTVEGPIDGATDGLVVV